MTEIYKRRKLGPVLEVADALEREWWPSIQPFTRIDLRSNAARLMHTDAAERGSLGIFSVHESKEGHID